MTIQGPQSDAYYHIEPVDSMENNDKEKERKQKQQVNYQGHQWAEGEDDLLLEKQLLQKREQKEAEGTRKKKQPLFIDKILLNKAERLLDQLTTVEDKIAQLCFYKTEASYDLKIQTELSELLCQWQLGGILFLSGTYKRQAYLIEYYQTLSTIPLLIGNDFTHNLSFYFYQKKPNNCFTIQNYRDLGKAIMGQNRSLGVHFLFDREIENSFSDLSFNEEQKVSFRKGIRAAHGVVARNLSPAKGVQKIHCKQTPAFSAFFNMSFGLISSEYQKNKPKTQLFNPSLLNHPKNDFSEQFIGMCTLFLQECPSQEKVIKAFKEGYEGFLIDGNVQEVIETFVQIVKKGEISEEELDKRVLKILALKIYFQG